jgi:hypothetical protein
MPRRRVGLHRHLTQTRIGCCIITTCDNKIVGEQIIRDGTTILDCNPSLRCGRLGDDSSLNTLGGGAPRRMLPKHLATQQSAPELTRAIIPPRGLSGLPGAGSSTPRALVLANDRTSWSPISPRCCRGPPSFTDSRHLGLFALDVNAEPSAPLWAPSAQRRAHQGEQRRGAKASSITSSAMASSVGGIEGAAFVYGTLTPDERHRLVHRFLGTDHLRRIHVIHDGLYPGF